jgi:hypothetical protein
MSRWINRIGFVVLLGSTAGFILSIFAPYRYEIGPIKISFRMVRNPMIGMLIGYVMWRMTYDGFGAWLKNRVRWAAGGGREYDVYLTSVLRRWFQLWKGWKWRERAMLLLVLVQAGFVVRIWQRYPSLLEFEREAHANMFIYPTSGDPGSERPILEHFCREVCEKTPPNARILFHGGTAGMRLAYEIYPRRVFILPQEMTAMAESWHVQPQLCDLTSDAHEEYWHQFLPHTTVQPSVFIRQHRINYIATFDEYDLSRCRLEPAP